MSKSKKDDFQLCVMNEIHFLNRLTNFFTKSFLLDVPVNRNVFNYLIFSGMASLWLKLTLRLSLCENISTLEIFCINLSYTLYVISKHFIIVLNKYL